MMTNQVRRAIDSGLSCLRVTDKNYKTIMDNAREGKKVKKKLPVAFVLIMVLILAAVTALAATGFLDYARTLLQIDNLHSNSFQDWPAQDKIELVKQLAQSGYLDSGSEVARLLSGDVEEGEADLLAETILTDWLDAPADHVGFLPVMEKIWGTFSAWTLEQKAWFSQTMIDAGIQQPDFEKYVLPGPEHISMELAIRSAQSSAEIWMGVPAGAFDGYGVVAEFVIFPEKRPDESGAIGYTTDGVPPCWLIRFSAPDGAKITGAASSCSVEVDAFTAKPDVMHFIGHLQYYHDGPRSTPAGLKLQADQDYTPFFDWPLEAKAEWSEKVRPQVLEREKTQPGYYDDTTVAFSRYVYGVPDEAAIREEDAAAKAENAIQKTYGMDAERLDLYNLVYSYYDITEPGLAKWRFHWSAYGQSADTLSGNDYSRLRNYRVEVDAHTGEIVSLEEYEQGNYTGYDAIMKWL